MMWCLWACETQTVDWPQKAAHWRDGGWIQGVSSDARSEGPRGGGLRLYAAGKPGNNKNVLFRHTGILPLYIIFATPILNTDLKWTAWYRHVCNKPLAIIAVIGKRFLSMGHFRLFSMILKFSMGPLLSFYTDFDGPFSKIIGLWRMAPCLPNHCQSGASIKSMHRIKFSSRKKKQLNPDHEV